MSRESEYGFDNTPKGENIHTLETEKVYNSLPEVRRLRELARAHNSTEADWDEAEKAIYSQGIENALEKKFDDEKERPDALKDLATLSEINYILISQREPSAGLSRTICHDSAKAIFLNQVLPRVQSLQLKSFSPSELVDIFHIAKSIVDPHVNYVEQNTLDIKKWLASTQDAIEKQSGMSGSEESAFALKELQEALKNREDEIALAEAIDKSQQGALSPEEQKCIDDFSAKFDPFLCRAVKRGCYNKEDLVSSIRTISYVEKIRPGAVTFLATEYGVMIFRLDNLESLIELYDNGQSFLTVHSFKDMDEQRISLFTRKIHTIHSAGGSWSIRQLHSFFEKNKPQLAEAIEHAEGVRLQLLENLLKTADDILSLEFVAQMYARVKHFKYKIPGNNFEQTVLPVLELAFKKYGLEKYVKPFLDSWATKTEDGANIVENLLQIKSLEEEFPGSTKMLFEEFGIRNFDRYPTELLLSQVKTRHKQERPYGVIVNPTNDWNGGFSHDIHLWSKLSADLQTLGYDLKVVEADGKHELARHLIRLTTTKEDSGLRSKPTRKISFAFIGGHGGVDTINFGGKDKRHSLFTEDLAGSGIRRSKHYFEDQPTLVLNSCSTGAENGIGKTLSETMNGTVIAPDKSTSIKDIHVTKDGTSLHFKVTYNDVDARQLYVKGLHHNTEQSFT